MYTYISEVETIKRETRATYGCMGWLQTRVRDCGLGLRPRLYAGYVCDDSAVQAAYAAIVALTNEPHLLLLNANVSSLPCSLYMIIQSPVTFEHSIYGSSYELRVKKLSLCELTYSRLVG